MESQRQHWAAMDGIDAETLPPSDGSDERFQDEILGGVSRTFALTIPELPEKLRTVVANGYLLCRIADTIEDDAELDASEKDRYFEAFLDALREGKPDASFPAGLHLRLSARTLPDERILVREFARVARITWRLPTADRDALLGCVSKMGQGMARYERSRSRAGLDDVGEMLRYCYFVAGVVGEMLTELFCNHSRDIAARRDLLDAAAVDFGLGLQMTNILKDIWDDLERDTCWLPRDLFDRHGVDLARLGAEADTRDAAFAAAIRELVGIAHHKLQGAITYTLAVPGHETGIRRFLAWALLLALMTLRNIHDNPLFTCKEHVKVPRRKVKAIITVSNSVIRHDGLLRALFRWAGRGLPTNVAESPADLANRRRISMI
jgi:farnesyl-diphosphate farnesyltransferase